ncbi:Fumarylacetoacetase [Pleurostoma richardsiae]|uniref:Fumarylacetoacetase n=1 Tax=Pleurostoma richardsiae TaxID=41990 RepID=A0AA38RY27_9PEZI|nr:Fumarylacetoacetase [Pleurostoma richardsiae]
MASLACEGHFSDRNIPFGIACSKTHPERQAVTRLGDSVLFLSDLAAHGLFSKIKGLPDGVFSHDFLNAFAALGRSISRAVREVIQEIFRNGGLGAFPQGAVEELDAVTMHLPVYISDFTDFSCSVEHVKNAGRIIIDDERPPPAFFNFPIAYQGRASSVVVSGTPIQRPMGQYRDKTTSGAPVVFGQSRAVDYELEFAAVVGKPLAMRQRLKATEADDHIFGFVVLNDWSARDIQAFEMTPLGPANGKNLGTTISPWIVTLDALEPFRLPSPPRTLSVPPHLDDGGNGAYAVRMQAEVVVGHNATVTGVSQVQWLYWTIRQMAAHIASAGASLRTGDLLATGTVSGPGKGTHGCLLEATEGGTSPVRLENGSTRGYLEDGDAVRMTAVAGDGKSSVGWGECVGQLLPAQPFNQ